MTPADLERFRRLAGMLGSEHVGERAAAALKCTELLKAAGLTWSSVSLPVEAEPEFTPEQALEEVLRRRREKQTSAYADKWAASRYGADADGFEPGRK